jgi:hypothetical protein
MTVSRDISSYNSKDVTEPGWTVSEYVVAAIDRGPSIAMSKA